MDTARYDKISIEAFQRAMDACLADPGPRSARAVLRITREQMLARPGGRYEAAQPVTLSLVAIALAVGAFAFLGSGPVAEQLKEAKVGYGAPLAAVMAFTIFVNGRKLAASDRDERLELLRIARAAWATLGPHLGELDDITLKDTRKLLS